MAVRAPAAGSLLRRFFSSGPVPRQLSAPSLEIAPLNGASKHLKSLRIAAAGNHRHIAGIPPGEATPGSSQAEGASVTSSPKSPASAAVDFLTLCRRLKTTKRKGWINHGIMGPESIADHMYRMALMALITTDLPGVDRERCIKLAIIHDIAEAIVGDITPSDGIPKVEKSRLEEAALNEMCGVLGGGHRADEIKELWAEYENNTSLEANLVKDFDKVEMILQALEYESEHGKVLDEFFLSTAGTRPMVLLSDGCLL